MDLSNMKGISLYHHYHQDALVAYFHANIIISLGLFFPEFFWSATSNGTLGRMFQGLTWN